MTQGPSDAIWRAQFGITKGLVSLAAVTLGADETLPIRPNNCKLQEARLFW